MMITLLLEKIAPIIY